jgi:hypothetical protein
MPDSTQGFSGSEIVDYVISYIGNESTEFRAVVTALLPMAEYRYCKAHDWKFLQRNNLPLTVASGTNEYTLNTAAITCEMKAEDVHSIYSPTSGIYLKRTTLEEIRRMDVKQDDGTTESDLTMWAPSGDNKIVVHPKVFADTELRIDGKCSPAALLTLSNYPTIPFRNQESFIKYVLAQAMERENDARADSVKQEAVAMIRQDVQDDMSNGGSSADEPRIKHYQEAGADGVGGDLEALWIASMFR